MSSQMVFSEVHLYILSQNNELLTPSFANGIHCVDIFEFADALFQSLFKAVPSNIVPFPWPDDVA